MCNAKAGCCDIMCTSPTLGIPELISLAHAMYMVGIHTLCNVQEDAIKA